jgi:hypothetical protein
MTYEHTRGLGLVAKPEWDGGMFNANGSSGTVAGNPLTKVNVGPQIQSIAPSTAMAPKIVGKYIAVTPSASPVVPANFVPTRDTSEAQLYALWFAVVFKSAATARGQNPDYINQLKITDFSFVPKVYLDRFRVAFAKVKQLKLASGGVYAPPELQSTDATRRAAATTLVSNFNQWVKSGDIDFFAAWLAHNDLSGKVPARAWTYWMMKSSSSTLTSTAVFPRGSSASLCSECFTPAAYSGEAMQIMINGPGISQSDYNIAKNRLLGLGYSVIWSARGSSNADVNKKREDKKKDDKKKERAAADKKIKDAQDAADKKISEAKTEADKQKGIAEKAAADAEAAKLALTTAQEQLTKSTEDARALMDQIASLQNTVTVTATTTGDPAAMAAFQTQIDQLTASLAEAQAQAAQAAQQASVASQTQQTAEQIAATAALQAAALEPWYITYKMYLIAGAIVAAAGGWYYYSKKKAPTQNRGLPAPSSPSSPSGLMGNPLYSNPCSYNPSALGRMACNLERLVNNPIVKKKNALGTVFLYDKETNRPIGRIVPMTGHQFGSYFVASSPFADTHFSGSMEDTTQWVEKIWHAYKNQKVAPSRWDI